MLGARDQVCATRGGPPVPPGHRGAVPHEGPEVHRLLAVTTAAGAPTVATVVRWWVDGIDREEAEALLGGRALAAVPYVCVHPGASRNDNRWPAADFAAVGDRLAASGCRVVLTGSRAEAALTRQVAGAMTAPAVDLGGETTVRTLAAVFAGARLVVSNDTGAARPGSRRASAERRRVPRRQGDPERRAPLDRERHRVVVPASPAERWPTVPAVVDAASRQLAARHRTRRGRDGARDPGAAMTRPLRLLTWHVHGNYLWYLSHIPHEIVLPVRSGRPHGYGGRAGSFPWPDSVREVPVEHLGKVAVDAVIYQAHEHWMVDRHEVLSAAQRAVPQIVIEHDPPRQSPTDTRAPGRRPWTPSSSTSPRSTTSCGTAAPRPPASSSTASWCPRTPAGPATSSGASRW